MNNNVKPWQLTTKVVQALGWTDQQTGAITPSIHPATTFIRDPDNQYRSGYSYGRDTNPSYVHAEAVLADLEHGADALVFASGMAAAVAVFQALPTGAHVLIPEVMYWALRQWLQEVAKPAGLDVEFFANSDIEDLGNRLRPAETQLIWLETPANPMWSITDIKAVAALAKQIGARVCVDNTVATPVLTQPLDLGADLVMHSATKYLNGHSDVIAGVLVAAAEDELWQKIRKLRQTNGAILGAFEAWLLLRGMRTLFLRVREASQSAQRIAEYFVDHPAINEVLYPGLASHPDHSIAAQQMTGGFGGMLSLRVQAGEAAAVRMAANVSLWKRATSLGGVESLIEHRASVEGSNTPVPTDLLRLSVGIESVDDLIADLEQALA